MRRSKQTDGLLKNSGHNLKDHDVGVELTSAWKGLAQSKAALRHIENRLEAGPGTGVLLESITDHTKKKSLRKTRCREGQHGDHSQTSTNKKGRSQHSPEKSSSRSPLRNSTQDNTVRNSVEFREPLASYREATPPPCLSSPHDLYSLQSVPGSSYSSQPSNSNPVLSHLVYQRDTRDKHTDRDLDSTHSSALESMEVRYLNAQPAVDILRAYTKDQSDTPFKTGEATQTDAALKAQILQSSKELTSSCIHRGESTPSTSPGSASQRLENLRRHQPDNKLEKLKERIRKQRQHLEEAVEREKSGSSVEQPIMGNGKCVTSNTTTVKVRKVAHAPPAPIYKGFNGTETKIQTPDGKIWNQEEFHNLSREIYKDLSRQFAERTKSQLQERGDLFKERRSHKSVRKVQKVGTASDLNAKPVISPASWREGQKLVTMVLGQVPRVTTEESQTPKRQSQKASHHKSTSDQRSQSNRQTCIQNTATEENGSQFNKSARTFFSAAQETAPLPVSSDMLSADINGLLDDLQLDRKTAESNERARSRSRRGSSGRQGRGGSGSRTRAPVSVWKSTAATRCCRSVSPTHRPRTVDTAEVTQKKRHYDADTVRQYIAQQQEKRKRRQVEEKKALRDEAEKRNQRLQELYRKQREAAKTMATAAEVSAAPVQKRLQETFNKLLLEGAQLEQEATQMRPMYQPSGESDKENVRLGPDQSPSSSERSLNNPPMSRNDLDYREASSVHLEPLIPSVQPVTSPVCSNDHLLSQLLRLETALAASQEHTQRPATVPNHSQAKMSRIEALKATASSLSNRIESEACKLVGEGYNYGLLTAADLDTMLASRASQNHCDDSCWMETAVNKSNALENENKCFDPQQSLYNGTGFPGFVNMFKAQKEQNRNLNSITHPQASSASSPSHKNYPHEKKRLANGYEINDKMDKRKQRKEYGVKYKEDQCTDGHDSSSGSISEGPLSEGSLTDGELSPSHPTNAFRPIGHREAVQYSLGKSGHRLTQFQKDAEKCATLNSLLAHQENAKPAWEEFNKGSPLSVINIFTKKLQENAKASDTSEKNSPCARLLPPSNFGADAVYENGFVSTQSSESGGKKDLQQDFTTTSAGNHYEELLRKSSEKHVGDSNSLHSPLQSPQRSSGSTSGSSPHSKHSTKLRGKMSDQSDSTLVEEYRSSPASEAGESRKRGSERSSVHSQATSGDVSGLSPQSSSLEANSSAPLRRNSPERTTASTAYPGLEEVRATGEKQYSPAVLQQRLAAELHYLESIEESVRQLGDIERLMGVSIAQHESASLAQMFKAKQQQHEQELYELKIKTEREALETKLQMEENMQRVARANIELQQGLAATQKETLEGLQEATTKMMSQQAEAARYTADTAQHIKEMTEMAFTQLTLKHSSVPTTSDRLREQYNSHAKQSVDNGKSYESGRRTRSEEHQSALNTLSPSDHSESVSSRSPGLSGVDTSHNNSPLSASSEHKERKMKLPADWKRRQEESKDKTSKDSASIEDEVPTVANDSLCSDIIQSAVEEKGSLGDSTSVATEYSHKFDESVTEDEMEERSFRSLLPSEAHRRESLDKKLHLHDESEEDGASQNSTVSSTHNVLKPQDVPSAFSGGQDSFSHFTMEMVRQYMRDEDVRLQHQSSLLRLRQKALKEKTRAELAWLEHQKKKLRDKGEDDKMPPIKKKQRGLLLKLQQEQAEIKRLQEANKAARKERQLLLKQQEEIERMRCSTLKLKERLRCSASEAPSETFLSEVASSNLQSADPDVRSPSPSVSVSGSETSSIMHKLKKMRSQMDEKFLTKREQQLMQRRHHAEELLQWKQRLDQEEAEVRKMEKKALAVWNDQTSQHEPHDLSEKEIRTSHSQKRNDFTDEVEVSSVTPESSIHTDVEVQDDAQELAKHTSSSEILSIQSSPANYTDEFTSVSPSPSRQTSTIKGNVEVSASSDHYSKAEQDSDAVHETPNQKVANGSPVAKQTELVSDQSDIESRIRALKEELKKRKFTAYQLKKEQKKRTKARLKAQEANLLKQLETYNDFIEKTKAELNKPSDSTPDTESQNISCAEHHLSSHRSSVFRKISESVRIPTDIALPDQSRSTSVPSVFSDEDPPTVTPTPQQQDSPECLTPQLGDYRKYQAQKNSGPENISEHGSEIKEELKLDTCKMSENESSECLLKLDKDEEMDTPEPTSYHSPSVRLVLDGQIDIMQISETEKDVKSLHTLDKSVKTETRPNSSCVGDLVEQDIEVSPLLVDNSKLSVDSSLGDQNSEPVAKDSEKTILQKNVPVPLNDSKEEEIAEEIAEELSGLSGFSNGSHQFKRVAGKIDDLGHDGKNIENSSLSLPVTPTVADEMPGFNIGDRVVVSGVQPGTLRFKGPTSFANGFWAGVELDKSEGSNNGTYDGVLYFECTERHGIFAPPDKITHLTEKFDMYTDTTEDDDSFFDDMSEDENEKSTTKETKPQKEHLENEPAFYTNSGSGDNKVTDDVVHMDKALDKPPENKESKLPISNGKSIWDFGDVIPTPLIEDTDTVCMSKPAKTHITNLVEKSDVDLNHHLAISSDMKIDEQLKDKVGTLADKLLNNFVIDTVQQFAQIKKCKAKKIIDASHLNGNVFEGVEEEGWASSVHQKDDLPFFLKQEKEELSSPEFCNRPESPVLGASGQEELSKRLAELELSRELEEFGDDQDWFDEDFGLSSRREQQRLKQKQREDEEQAAPREGKKSLSGAGTSLGGLVPSPGEQQVKTPPRPELPLPMPPKLPEEPAMVVPHSATEVEKMVYAATLEIWETCDLNKEETLTLTQHLKPNPSNKYFGEEPHTEDQEAICLRSYKKAVYDLTWEILQDIFAEDPNANQPQWVKPQRVKSSSFQRVKTPGDITSIQEFITAQVLKLYGLTKDQGQKTDWPKMLKFGRKKRDRVDNILVQELHEEEAQWVNYDEDELFVKIQLADGIFDALLKDTADVLTQIYDKKAERDGIS